MMKNVRTLCAVALTLLLCSAFTVKEGSDKDKKEKKDKQETVYAFGVGASFNDTVVYFTNIQVLDSVQLDKEGFLPKRELYAYQLKNYLDYDLKSPNYTCMIYFNKDKAKLSKEQAKLQTRYKKAKLAIVPIDAEAFAFTKPEEEQ
jgi:hypothetical protein